MGVRMSDFELIVVMSVIAIIVFVPMLLYIWVFGGKQMTSFQIHDDCPDWFMERINRELDKIFGRQDNAKLS